MQTADYWTSLARQAWGIPQHLSDPAALRAIARRAHEVEPDAVGDPEDVDSGRLLALMDALASCGAEGQLDALFSDEFSTEVSAAATAKALVSKAERNGAADPGEDLCRVVLAQVATFGLANPRRLTDGSFGPWGSA